MTAHHWIVQLVWRDGVLQMASIREAWRNPLARTADRAEVTAKVPLSTSAVLIITVTVGAALAWGALLMAAQYLIRGRLDRRRIAGWDTEWRRIEPLWSGRSRDEGATP